MPRSDVIPSPNIWNRPDVYEQENLGVDPAQVIEKATRAIHDWAGRAVLDIGCGTGFHLPTFAESGAAKVIGVEPHDPLRAVARKRSASSPFAGKIDVRKGTAQRLPVADSSIDVAHARWAYFFGPGCEPGLEELSRVMRRGGTAFVIDNDATRSTFGGWFRRATRDWRKPYDPAAIERFWARRAGSVCRWTSAGTTRTGPRSKPSYASSSPPTWPTRSSPATTARRSITRSTSSGAPSHDHVDSACYLHAEST